MPILTTSLLSVSLALASQSTTAYSEPVVPESPGVLEWQVRAGDRFLVDTQSNEGYLIHTDGKYVKFPVVTGQNRYVRYIGRSYKATTPAWNWEVQAMDIKGDHLTFGPSGRFLRLFKNGDEETAYGIHEYGKEEDLFSEKNEERFRSMGCIIVRQNMMDIIVKTYQMNEGKITVVTKYGIPDTGDLLAHFGQNAAKK